MRNNLNTCLFILVLIFAGPLRSYSQATCGGAAVICPNPAYPFNSVAGTGLPPGLTISNPVTNPQGPNNGCMLTNAPNPEWLIIDITCSGMLGFSFGSCSSPNPQNGYLHWIMWPYSAGTCTDITGNTQAPVACNYNCSSTGGTGMGPIPAACGGSTCNYQNSIPVNAGEQYLILVSNGSGTPALVSFESTGTACIACTTLSIPSVTACPTQTVVTTANWPGNTATTYSLYAPPSGNPPIAIQPSPNFSVSSNSTNAVVIVYTVVASGTDPFSEPVSATQNFSLTIAPNATIAVAQATNYCYGTTANLSVTPGQGTFVVTGPSCGGTSAPTTNSNIPIGPLYASCNGLYSITASLTTGCTGTVTTQINVAPNYFISTTPTLNVCLNSTALLTASMPTALNYTWTYPNGSTVVVNGVSGNTSINNVQLSDSGSYCVQAYINYNGITCLQTACTKLNVVQTFSIDAPASYTYCQGLPASLSATVHGNPIGFSWTGPNGYTGAPGVSNPIITNSILCNQAGNYAITANFSNGFLSCPVTVISNIQVVCYNPPAVLVPSIICQYQTANLAVVPSGPWISLLLEGPLASGFSSTNTTTNIPNIQPINSGPYTATVIYAIGTQTCESKGYNQITVVAVNPIITSTPAPVCYPASLILYASSIGAATYSWSGPTGLISYQQNFPIYYPPISASGVYTVFTSYNSSGLTCYNTNTVFVSINPTLSFTLPAYIQSCAHTTLSLDGPTGATSYLWNSSTGYGANTSTQNLDFGDLTPDQSGVYTLSVALGPCPSTAAVQLEVLTPVQFTLWPQSRTVCPDTTFFDAGATGGSQNYAFTWNPSNGLSSPTGSHVTAILAGTTIYNVTLYDIACPTVTFAESFSVVVNQPPVPNLQLDKTEGCDPFCLYLEPGTESQAAITTYDFGGVLKMQADTGFTYCLPGPGTYTLKVHSEGKNGCIGTYQYPSPIIVDPRSHSDIQWTPETPSTTDNLVTFIPVPKSGTVIYYNWMFSGTGTSGFDTSDVKNPQRKFDDVGLFPIMLISTTNKGCTDTTVKFLSIKDELNVFVPNTFTPNGDGVNDFFQVKGVGFTTNNFNLEVFDRWGHSVFSSKDPLKGWDGTIKGQSPQEGVYIYRVDVIGANGEGKKEYMGHVTLLK